MTKEEMASAMCDATEPMVYVAYGDGGGVRALWAMPTDEATGILPESHEDVIAFRQALAVRLAARSGEGGLR